MHQFQLLTSTAAKLTSLTPAQAAYRARSGKQVAEELLPTALAGMKVYMRADGYWVVSVGQRRVLAHIFLAEKALGRALPPGVQVHHVDENPANNAPSNLVICPDAAYHKLLHQRQRAFDASGHYGWRKCQHCGQYDAPENLWTSRKKAAHRTCSTAARRAHNATKKGTHV